MMMTRCRYIAVVVLSSAVLTHAAVLQHATVFSAGESGYACFRIPTIVKANDGTLIAIAEGRVDNCLDFVNTDLVMKRSTDGGRTWGSLSVLDDNGVEKSWSPVPVVDKTTGDVVVMFNRSLKDSQVRDDTVMVRRSTDNGLTWSAAFDVTPSTFDPGWEHAAPGPVHGIQLEHGPNAGRLIVPGKHILADQPLEPDGRAAHVWYSDDGGFTWAIGAKFLNPNYNYGPNEATVIELNDGSLYMSARNQGGGSRHRLVGTSPDGIQDFDGDPNDGVVSSVVETQLPDARVQGSLLRTATDRIMHSHVANDTTDRYHLSISSSSDETQSWGNRRLVHRTLAAYSDLVNVQGDEYGMIYGVGHSSTIHEIRFGWFDETWLDDSTAIHYEFSSTNLDSSGGVYRVRSSAGFDYDAQAISSTTLIAASPDYPGDAALRFTTFASGDALRIYDATDSSNLEFEHEDSFTIEAVFRTTQHGSNTGIIFDKSETGNSNGEYSIGVSNGKLSFHLRDLLGNQANLSSTLDVNDGEWHHVAAVRNAQSQRIYIYIDHEFAGTVIDLTTADFGDINVGQAETPIIGSSVQGLYQFGGDLQHLKISIAALTPDQFIQKLIPALPGDLDGDGFVGITDLNIVLGAWNQTVATGDLLAGDPSGDGFVGIEDLNVVLGNWNTGIPPGEQPTHIPEPQTAAAMLLLATLVGRGRGRTTYTGSMTRG